MIQLARTLGLLSLALVVSVVVSANSYQTGEVLVRYKAGYARLAPEMNRLYEKVGVEDVEYYSGMLHDFELLKLEEGVTVEDAVQKLQNVEMVAYAQPNYILSLPRQVNLNQPAPPGGALPCIPGMEVPNCDPELCWLPGLPMPPGCKDWGGGTPGEPGNPGNPGNPPGKPGRPVVQDPPAEVNPPVADPSLSQAWGIAKIGSEDAWKSHTGNKEMIVAVIDTGIDYNHEDLSFNVWRNPNPTQNDVVGFDFIHNDGLPYDDQGHGTHTAGTVGAVGGNGKGVSGVSQRVSIMGLKFLSASGSGTTADAIKAIDYAVANGARILSNSWGGRGDVQNKALQDAITRAEKKDVLFIAAAGNDGVNNDNGGQASYPAAFDNENIIAVAATDQNDKMAFFSNYGKKSTDLAAPGVNVYSLAPGNKYIAHSGTSMACPHVAGAAALIWSQQPNLTHKQVKEILMKSVDPVTGLESKLVTGGRLNVLKALRTTE